MNITVTFNSEAEFKQFINSAKRLTEFIAAAKEAQILPVASDAENPVEKAKTAAPLEETQEKEAAPEVSEDMRVEVRRILAQLNKKTGKNIARDLIKDFGVKQLTEVPLKDLPALLEKAKEAFNAE